MRKKIALKADPVLIDFFASIDDEVQAFESDANQAQYSDIGSMWYPQQFSLDQDNVVSPNSSVFVSDIAQNQSQIQKQLEQTEKMFASAGFSLQAPASGYPAPLSNQSSFGILPIGPAPFNQGAMNQSANPFATGSQNQPQQMLGPARTQNIPPSFNSNLHSSIRPFQLQGIICNHSETLSKHLFLYCNSLDSNLRLLACPFSHILLQSTRL